MKKVHVAIFIYRGVLNDLEVFAEPEPAQAKADEWKQQATPNQDVVTVVQREIIVVGTPIKELSLPWLYQRRLERNGIRTVEQLTEMTRRQLYFYRNIGVKCIEQVELALAERGKSLQEEPPKRSVAEI